MKLESEEKTDASSSPNNNSNNNDNDNNTMSSEIEVEMEKHQKSYLIESRHETMSKIIKAREQDDPFFLCDKDELIKNYKYWTETCQNFTPYFDTSRNNSAMVINTLSELGSKFSCQNKLEMENLSKLGIHPEDVVFGSSVKVASHIRFATDFGVELMQFETAYEIKKIQKSSPNAKLLYRLNFPSPAGETFSPSSVVDLFKDATESGLQVVGVSVNITESGIMAFKKAISVVRIIFCLAENLGHAMTIFDLGELAPVSNNLKEFEEIAETIQSTVASQFQSLSNFADLRVFAHPSTFIVESAFSLATKVIGKRVAKSDGKVSYVINDGIFGAFGRLLEDDFLLEPVPLDVASAHRGASQCDIFGPSGHDMDKICDDHIMDSIDIGDWIVFDNMGTFTMSDFDNKNLDSKSSQNSSDGAFHESNNMWFFSRNIPDNNASLDESEGSDLGNESSSEEDDDQVMSAFFELPDFEFNLKEEEIFSSMLR